jgi:hypothetical protein
MPRVITSPHRGPSSASTMKLRSSNLWQRTMPVVAIEVPRAYPPKRSVKAHMAERLPWAQAVWKCATSRRSGIG